jgi:transposase-like protein
VPATDGGVYESACPKHGQKQKDGINKKTGRQTYKCPKCTAERMTTVEEMTQTPTPDADDMPPKCPEHNVTKVKDGHKRGGARRWRCLVCNPRVREGTPRAACGQLSGLAAYHAAKVKDHPLCETCSEHARIEKRIVRAEDGATIIYWTCTVNGCKQVHAPTVKELPVEEIERRITGAVAQANGHDPQNRSDIVNELIRRLLAKEITLTQVTSRTTVREVAKEISSLYQDKYGKDSPLPLDAPMPGKDGDDSKKTYADQLESRGMNPEEELIAKEVSAGEE